MPRLEWHVMPRTQHYQFWHLENNPTVKVRAIVQNGCLYDFGWYCLGHGGIEQSLEACEDHIIPLLVARRMTS